MVEKTLIAKIREHYESGDMPATPGRTQLMLTVGLIENYLGTGAGRHEGYLEDLKKTLIHFGLSEVRDNFPPEYDPLRFFFERRITIEDKQSLPGVFTENSGALVMVARGYDASKPGFDTIFGATVYDRTTATPGTPEALRVTAAFIPFSHFYDRGDPDLPSEIPLFLTNRETISGTILQQAENFSVTLDHNRISSHAFDTLRLLTRKTAPGRRTKHEVEPRDLPPDILTREWLKHFAIETTTGGSQYYAHFPRPTQPLLDFT